MTSVYLAPSFYSLVATGFAILFLLIGYYKAVPIDQLMFWTLFSILVGIHGVLHFQMETGYGFVGHGHASCLRGQKRVNARPQGGLPLALACC